MTFAVIHRDATRLVGALDPVIPAGQAAIVMDAARLLAEARQLRDEAQAAAQAAAEVARAEGHAAGLAEGRRTAQAELGAKLFELQVKAAAERDRMRAEVAALSVETIKRIAGELGHGQVVPALAAKAAAALAPDEPAEVRVAPQQADAVAARLARMPNLRVTADPDLSAGDLVIDTSLGRALAGLDTQLGRIADRWAEMQRAPDAG